MDTETLSSVVHDDLPLYIDAVRAANGSLVLEVTCKDWEQTDGRPAYARRLRGFDSFCDSPGDRRVRVGDSAGCIRLADQHPVLLAHAGPPGDLFHSSALEPRDEVFCRAHATLGAAFDGWIEPSRFLNGTIAVPGKVLVQESNWVVCDGEDVQERTQLDECEQPQ
jgi:hypothetical protein